MVDFEQDNFLKQTVAEYLTELAGESPEPAASMEQEANRREFPIVGPQVGRFLALLTEAIDPSTIVELGSGFGYSAYWFGRGTTDADIHLTEYNAENLESARNYLDGVNPSVNYHYHEGDALETLESIEGTIDLFFLDIDKPGYTEALDHVEDRLDQGGWFLADNVLWKGWVADDEKQDEATRTVREFNERLQGDSWTSSILPIRDGLAVARRR